MISILLSFQLITAELSTDRADYDGKTVTLTGNFELSHPLGHIHAEKATLENMALDSPLLEREMPLFLEGGVKFTSKNTSFPFSLSANRAFCEIPPFFSLTEFQEILFFKQVELSLYCARPETSRNASGIASGGSAIYKEGTFTLYPSIPKTHCLISQDTNEIKASAIFVHLEKKRILCQNPRGFFPLHSLRFSANTLEWENEILTLNGAIAIKQPGLTIEAEKGKLICSDKLSPSLIFLEGNVRLISSKLGDKLSFATADAITFNPIEKTALFSSLSPQKVLFRQEGLMLSATRVLLTQDPETKKESIHGEGDVRFIFTSEEQNYLEELFSKYL